MAVTLMTSGPGVCVMFPPTSVARWAAANGVEITGAPREVYFVDFRSAAPGDEVCDVAFPVR